MQVDKTKLEGQIGVASWGTFFVWVGACFLVGIGWAAGLLGVAAIILGAQGIRAAAGIGAEGFWLFVGGLFAAAGLWHLFDLGAAFGPVLLVAIGAAILLVAFFGKRYRHAG